MPLIEPISTPGLNKKAHLLRWLQEENPDACEELWESAHHTQCAHVGREIHLRALIEISNYCERHCLYCGIRKPNQNIKRYRLSQEMIVKSAQEAIRAGYRTIVLQAGEDPSLTKDWIAELITKIRDLGDVAITLSLGERTFDELKQWKQTGANRYLLRFETSNRTLYNAIHPNSPHMRHRLEILQELRTLGYEVGSGAMVGIPGQSYEDVANDILRFSDIGCDMIGIGPYLSHPDTPLGNRPAPRPTATQVPTTPFMVHKVLALTRLFCPYVNLPATTALLGCENDGGRLAFQRGANVLMINFTPLPYRSYYTIYPFREENKHAYDSLNRTQEAHRAIESLGLSVSTHKGNSLHFNNQKNTLPCNTH